MSDQEMFDPPPGFFPPKDSPKLSLKEVHLEGGKSEITQAVTQRKAKVLRYKDGTYLSTSEGPHHQMIGFTPHLGEATRVDDYLPPWVQQQLGRSGLSIRDFTFVPVAVTTTITLLES